MECNDLTGKLPFNLGNIIKYAWRLGLKGEPEDWKIDFRKVGWYRNHFFPQLEDKLFWEDVKVYIFVARDIFGATAQNMSHVHRTKPIYVRTTGARHISKEAADKNVLLSKWLFIRAILDVTPRKLRGTAYRDRIQKLYKRLDDDLWYRIHSM